MHINFSIALFYSLCSGTPGTFTLARWRTPTFFLIHFCFQVSVAGKAQIRIVRQQKRVEACFVRAVARCAFAGNHGGVFALDILDFLARIRAMA
jgi:hypothetical protein